MKTNLKLADAYYRLSVEEANGGESSSITNQRSIVRQYCEDNGITIVKNLLTTVSQAQILTDRVLAK